MYHVGPPGGGRLRRALPARLGRRRAQLPHQRLLVRGAARATACGAATTARRPTTPTPRSSCCCQSHLETGHYFNPHAQRIMEAKPAGAKLVVIDPRLSNTASHADLWLAPWPGSEAAILLAVARISCVADRSTATSSGAGSTGRPTSTTLHPDAPSRLRGLPRRADRRLRARTPSSSPRRRRGCRSSRSSSSREIVAGARRRSSAHVWRAAAAGNLRRLAGGARACCSSTC